jgi:hypothetical protein
MDKDIFKRDYYDGGIDYSIIDYSILGSIRVPKTKVTEPMFKKNGVAYVGLAQFVLGGEKIKVKGRDVVYHITGNTKSKLIKKGYLYTVRRSDGFSITQTDIMHFKKGAEIKIVNRRSFKQKMGFNDLFNREK